MKTPAPTSPIKPRRNFRKLILTISAILVGLMAAAAGLTLLAGAQAKAALAAEHPAPGQLIDVGGYKLHLNCTGEGTPTVILEAGLLDFSVQWSRVQPEVQQYTRVCSYDRAGLGWSEPSPQQRTSEAMVKELQTLLTEAGIEGPYVLVGHSFGGTNMRLFAHRYPEQVVGLILVDSAHEEQILRFPALLDTIQAARSEFRSLATLSTLGLIALRPEDIPNRNLPPEALENYRAILATTNYFPSALAEMEGMEESFREIREAHIKNLGRLPLIVLSRGQAEPMNGIPHEQQAIYEQTWQELQAELTHLSTQTTQVIAQQSQHNIQLDQPEIVIAAIRRMITNH